MLWRQKQEEEQLRHEVLTATLAIKEMYPEMSSAIWKKHDNPFITSLIFAQYAGVDTSACLSFSRNGLEYLRVSGCIEALGNKNCYLPPSMSSSLFSSICLSASLPTRHP